MVSTSPRVAILNSQDLIDDWIDHLGVGLDELRHELVGSWLFDYPKALKTAGVDSVLIFFSRYVRRPERSLHAPTGATLWLLPPPRVYSLARRMQTRTTHRRSLSQATLRHVVPYLATGPVALARVLRAERCNAILCQEYECPRFDVLVAIGRALGIPVFPSFHGGDYRSRLERLFHPLTVRASAGLIISSAAEAERARNRYRISADKIARISNPVDSDFWRAEDRASARASLEIPAEAVVAAWHGALYLDTKGLDLLLEAWDRVTQQRPDRDLRLVLVGGGADEPEVERLIQERALRGVELIGRFLHDRELIRRYLSAADFYVFPSRFEGHPNALIEAMSCGLPVISSDTTAIPELVGHGHDAAGIIVAREDVQALAIATARLVDDSQLRAHFAQHARPRVGQQFSPITVGRRLRDFMSSRGMCA